MVEGINEVKKLISDQIENKKVFVSGDAFTGFQKTYFNSNEDIKSYLNLINFQYKYNALTVLASGDQLFNLINKGIKTIDTFDINKLTEYYVFELRMAMIEKYNYKSYLKVLSILLNEKTSFEILNNILYELIPYMDTKYRLFWKEILDYNYNLQKNKKDKINITRMLFFGFLDNTKYNKYLDNEEEYNKLKNNLKNTKIDFEAKNATELHKNNRRKYDIVLMSNILDYIYNHLGIGWSISKIIKKYKSICNENADILLHYIFHYYSNNYTRGNDLIYGTNDLEKIIKTHPVIKLPIENETKIGDGIILIKK